ncbi:hypothetical protein [Rikenella microfusus]|uniref:hypothetical protein n=1 Tax=Rikenella microfusus TaxID=28139 RepID=UPI003AB480AC
MKNTATIIIAVVAGLLMGACNTTRRAASKSEVTLYDHSKIDKHKDSNHVLNRTDWDSIYWSVTENMKMHFHKLEYDSYKPVDSVTGKPPLKSETKGEIDMSKDSKGGSQSKTEAKDLTNVSEQDHSQSDVKTTEKQESTIEKQIRSSLWWLWLIAGAALTGVVWWFWKRFRWRL